MGLLRSDALSANQLGKPSIGDVPGVQIQRLETLQVLERLQGRVRDGGVAQVELL